MRNSRRLMISLLLVGLLATFVLGIGSEHDALFQLSSTTDSAVASIQHEVFVGNAGQPVLIICEENHASLEVQGNCQLAIEGLKTPGIRPVLLAEGTSPRQLELSSIFDVGSPSFRLAAAEAWFELGWLSGVEMAALRDSSLSLFGVEHPDGPERTVHIQAINHEYWAWKDYCGAVNDLLKRLSDQISLDCTERGARQMHFPQGVEGRFPQIAGALERAQQAEAAFERPVEDALPLAIAAGTLQQEIGRGNSIREALAALQRDFPGARTTFSTRFAAWEAALDALYGTIIETARQTELDVSRAEQLQQTYQERRAKGDTAGEARDRAMITNAKQALASVGLEVGILSIGAGHTAQLTQILRNQGISYLVITPEPPGLRLFTTPTREVEWLRRTREDPKPPTPLESWLRGAVKPELILADPEKQEALATDIALVRGIHRALRGEPPNVPDRLLIKDFRARSIPEGVEVSVEGVGGRQLRLRFPSDFALTNVAAQQLIRHLMEALEAGTRLMPRDDGFVSPAAQLYLEPDGVRGGAFVSHMPDASTLVMQAVSLELPASAEEMRQQHLDLLQTPSVKNLDDLLAPVKVLRPLVNAVNRTLDELDVPQDQVVPVVLRMARVSDEAIIRDINFTLLATIARRKPEEGFERRLMFVKSGLERDSEHLKVGSPERLLPSTLNNVHAWASTEKHVAVFTIPTSEEEWEDNPFAQYLETRLFNHQQYIDLVFPFVQDAIRAIGLDNVLEPQNLEQFLGQLEGALNDASDATVTITFVGHRPEIEEGLWVHFKGESSATRLDTVVSQIRSLQEQGRIPASANLEFNVVVCSAEEGAAPQFIKQLDARLVLASPHEVGVATNMRLLINEAAWLGQGIPAYRAYLNAVETLVEDFFNSHLPSLKLTEPFATETGREDKAASA